MISKVILRNEIFITGNYLDKCFKNAEKAEKAKNEEAYNYWNDLAMRTEIERDTLNYLYHKYFD